MLEFAFAMPVLIGLLMGGVEFARFALVNQKMERVTSFVGDFVARAEALDEADFDDYFAAADQLGRPFDLFGGGNIIVTSVTGEDTGPEVLWQQIGTGHVTAPSLVGLPGEPAVLPLNFNVDEGEGLVVTEVYFDYEPFLLPLMIPAQRLYYQSIYRPRTTAILAMAAE
ncbi:MAG: TadE/TadG family type IV pilus assembly protein [Proteobacteria bacterium]|nr:TadE/TadG family type IV pilus assembly protein [Pseudomonadota bacterium]